MANPSEGDAARPIDQFPETEQTTAPQSSSRLASETESAQTAGELGRAAKTSGEMGHDLDREGEAQAALNGEALGPFLDDLVAATIRLSDAQRKNDGQGVAAGAWRPLRALGRRLWRPDSKNARSHQR